MPDFDDMMNEVEQEIEGQDLEQSIIGRIPELKKLSQTIDQATTAVINAKLTLEESVRQCYRADKSLTDSVDGLYNKVDSINTHIDNVIKDAPTQLQVSVSVSDPDMQKVQALFDREHAWVTNQMRTHLKEVNDIFIAERRRVNELYKEYDGTYLGHYIQYFVWLFFTLGLLIFGLAIFLMLDSHYHWFNYIAAR